MKFVFKALILAFIFLKLATPALAQDVYDEGFLNQEASTTSAFVPVLETEPQPPQRTDITQTTDESREKLVGLLENQEISSLSPFNFVRHAIRASVEAGVAPNTIVLLLLLTLVVALIAAARHIIGIRGFGIFLPAALSIVFLAVGPIIGIFLFVVIVVVSTYVRVALRKLKIKMQYLPRMSLMLWFVVLSVLGVLFLAPLVGHNDFTNVSIFPVLILVLLSEDFSKVQLGKSPRTAINLASETIVTALVSYVLLTMQSLREFALLYPEMLLLGVLFFNLILGQYVGLRVVEYWRYRKLLSK